jgi:hypothetical protein
MDGSDHVSGWIPAFAVGCPIEETLQIKRLDEEFFAP